VQRVSDTVAILNKGHLVALGPIEELMAGKNGIVYFMTITGDAKSAQARIAAQPWVTSIKSDAQDAITNLPPTRPLESGTKGRQMPPI
jgi:ABC-type multidrug transport system ATPase subunit